MSKCVCNVCVCLGYGFVDFDSPASAQKAVTALKATGVQAQMAKVRGHNLQLKSVCAAHVKEIQVYILIPIHCVCTVHHYQRREFQHISMY